jgi:hypothetical protein
MQDFFKHEDDEQAAAAVKKVVYRACCKFVKDLVYNARWQAVVDYNAKILKVKITKKEAIKDFLTKEQYMKVVY